MPKRFRLADGQCLGCTFETRDSRVKLRRMFIRGHLRDLVHTPYSHLPANVQGHMSCSLAQATRDELTNQDHAMLISIPASLYSKVLALISWHYRTTTRTAIASVPPFDHSATEQWAVQCRSAFNLLDLKPLRQRTQLDAALQNDLAWLHTQAPALVSLQSTLRLHSGRSTELLETPPGRDTPRQHLSLAQLSVPAPADWSLRASSEAKCKVCGIYEHDRMDLTEGGDAELRVYKCIALHGLVALYLLD